MPSLAVGQPVRVVLRSDPGTPHGGVVTRISPLTDRETREVLVDITVNDLPRMWAVGQRAEVYIRTMGKDRALLVPELAIQWDKGTSGLFVSVAGRAAWRAVTLGLRGQDRVEAVHGVDPGESVVWPRDSGAGALTTLTLDKLHDIAVLKLIGARNSVILGMIVQQALLLGVLAYGVAYLVGQWVFPLFPRRVVIVPQDLWMLAGVVVGISVLASLLGIAKALSVEPSEVLA